MKRKISIILLLFTFIATNVQASIFNSVISIFSAKPAFKETDKSLHIYEDTQNHWCNFAAARLYNEGIFKGIQIGDKNYFMPDDNITRGEFLLYLNEFKFHFTKGKFHFLIETRKFYCRFFFCS